MPFAITDFARLRPFVYHVTDRANLTLLREQRRLQPAADLIRAAGRLEWLGMRREQLLRLETPGGSVVLKDQRPLIAANMQLATGWTLAEFVEYLNSFVYFWPGTDRGPIGPGQRLLNHYEADGPVVLRVPTIQLLEANPGTVPQFCAFNSGAPRYHSGKRAVRGPHLFKHADEFPRHARDVVELAFPTAINLPASTLLRASTGWVSLIDRAS